MKILDIQRINTFGKFLISGKGRELIAKFIISQVE